MLFVSSVINNETSLVFRKGASHVISIATQSPNPDAPMEALGLWVVCCSCVLGVIYMIAKTILMFRRQPPIDAQFATKTELRYLENTNTTMHDKDEERRIALAKHVTDSYDKLQASDEARTSGLHKRLDVIATDVAEQKGKLETALAKD